MGEWPPWPKRPEWLRALINWFVWVGGYGITDDGAPISLFGHRITWYGWGLRFRTRWGSLTLSKEGAWDGARWRRLYWSPNGTPSHEDARIFWDRHANEVPT